MVEVLLTIDIATIVSAIKLCVDIGETVLDNRKAVGELVDQLKIVHGLLKLLNPEAEKKANEYGLCDILKILNYITKKSSKIFNRLSRPEIIEKIQNIFWSSKFKKDLQRYTSGTLNVVASLNLLFNIMIAVINTLLFDMKYHYIYIILFLRMNVPKAAQH